MLMHELLTAIHVLGWVFWLGTDVGVFLAAKKSERRTDLSVESRLAVLELGMILDRAPRFAGADRVDDGHVDFRFPRLSGPAGALGAGSWRPVGRLGVGWHFPSAGQLGAGLGVAPANRSLCGGHSGHGFAGRHRPCRRLCPASLAGSEVASIRPCRRRSHLAGAGVCAGLLRTTAGLPRPAPQRNWRALCAAISGPFTSRFWPFTPPP